MIQRFFFNGIDAKSTGTAIGSEYDLIIASGSNKAHPSLTFFQAAEPRTKVTLNSAVTAEMPISSGLQIRLIEALHIVIVLHQFQGIRKDRLKLFGNRISSFIIARIDFSC
jgi:hypothetical protein